MKSVLLRISVADEAVSNFSYSIDGKKFDSLGDIFVGRAGMWIGAKVGLFSLDPPRAVRRGYAEYDWFRFK